MERWPKSWTILALVIVAVVLALARFNSAGYGSTPRTSSRELTIALAVFPSEAAKYREFLGDFERRDHVRVELIAQSYNDILQALLAQSGARNGGLDLVELDLSMLRRAHSSVRPLDSLVSPNAEALFPKAAWNAGRFDGHLFFVPHRLTWEAMIYNRKRVPHPPSTWAGLLAFARAHPGKVALKGARYEGATCDMLCFLWAGGGNPLKPEASGSLRAFEFLSRMAPYLNPESPVLREMSVLEAQARGSVWIHFNWPFAMGYLATKGLAPSVDLSAPIPAGPDGRATVLGGGYLAIPRSASHPRLAAEFIRYLLTRRAQARLSRDLGWYGSVGPPAGSEQARLYAGFAAMRPYVRARPTINCYAQLSNTWQRGFRAVLFRHRAPRAALQRVAEATATIRQSSTRGGARPCACR